MNVQTEHTTSAVRLIFKYLQYIEKVEGKAPKTVDNRRYILIPFFRWLQQDDILKLTIPQVDEYLILRSEKCKPSAINTERKVLKSFFAYCQEYTELPMQFNYQVIKTYKDKPPRIRTFSHSEIARVVQAASNIQDKLIISLMFETGIRIGELIALNIEDIYGNQIRIRGKGSVDRMVVMSGHLSAAIRDYMVRRRITAGKVFRPLMSSPYHPDDRYVSTYGVRDRIKAVFKKCGYIMHPHQLRHSFAVNWLMAGGDLRTLQILLGHAGIETTQRYLQLTDKQTEEIYNRVLPKSVLALGT